LPIKRACIAPATFDKAFKFIVTSHYFKTFVHFSKGSAIFCEKDQENANNGKDDEVIVWQKSNLPSLLSLASAISAQAALDALAPYNTLAATASFGQISLINLSATLKHGLNGFGDFLGCNGLVGFICHISLVGSIGRIGLSSIIGIISLICLNSHFGILGCINCISFVRSIGVSGISGLVNQISLVSLSSQNGNVNFICLSVNFCGLNLAFGHNLAFSHNWSST
jgi:hypothetical protein